MIIHSGMKGKVLVMLVYTTKLIDKNFYLNGGYYDYDTKTYMLNGAPANMDRLDNIY